MKKKILIDRQEEQIAKKLIELFYLEVINDIVCKDGIGLFINGRIIKMIKEGENLVDKGETLFRPTKSLTLANFLLQELFYIDEELDIYEGEDEEGNYSIKIYDEDHNLLSLGEAKNKIDSIIIAIFKFYFGGNSKYYEENSLK